MKVFITTMHLPAWKKDGNNWRYEDKAGYKAADEWLMIDGSWYYFMSNGIMAHDMVIGGYYVGSDGAWVR